jgi:hypothetical protein
VECRGFALFTLQLDLHSILRSLSPSCWHGFGVQLSVLTSHVELRMKNVCLYYLSPNAVNNIIHPKTVNTSAEA